MGRGEERAEDIQGSAWRYAGASAFCGAIERAMGGGDMGHEAGQCCARYSLTGPISEGRRRSRAADMAGRDGVYVASAWLGSGVRRRRPCAAAL